MKKKVHSCIPFWYIISAMSTSEAELWIYCWWKTLMLVYIIFPVFHLTGLYKNYVWIHTFHCPNGKLLIAVDFEHGIVFSSVLFSSVGCWFHNRMGRSGNSQCRINNIIPTAHLLLNVKHLYLNGNVWSLWRFKKKKYSWVWNVHHSVFIMNYSLFPHSPLLNVHHTCKCIMHFSLFSLTQILWSPVNNQPGNGFALLTHCIHCSFVLFKYHIFPSETPDPNVS